MIPLFGIITGLLFAYAVIVTGLLAGVVRVGESMERRVEELKAELDDEKNRNSASSLSEYAANKRMAMPIPDAAPEVRYGYDSTGLVRGVIEPTE